MISQKQKEALLADYKKGIPIKTLCEMYGFSSRNTLFRYLRGKTDRKGRTAQFKSAMIGDYKEGKLTIEQISIKYGVSKATVVKLVAADKNKQQRIIAYPQAIRDAVIEAYLSKRVLPKNIPSEFGITETTLYRWLKAHRTSCVTPSRRRVRITEEVRDKIVEAYLSGMTLKSIENLLGVSDGSIYRTLKERGITQRRLS